ncbi:MAG: sulfite exporter TauE/SafE family protein [Actinomycetota bacterium]
MWILPAAFTVGWVAYVTLAGHGERVIEHWRAAATMAFGSFVAGSTPQGGGAVAFPVFTKVLAVPAEVARSFSLSIQATGMMMASLTILIAGRAIDRKALGLATAGGAIGLVIGLLALGDPSRLFWPSRLDAAYVKVAFTVAIFAVAVVVSLCAGRSTKNETVPHWNGRSVGVVLGFSMIGGIFSSLAGSGVDVLLFIFLVLIADVHPKVAIPTSIIAMAVVSSIGFVLLGFVDGQLSIERLGDQVVAVGGDPIEASAATRFDLFGIWLAAAPVVVWGAPLGSWAAAKASERAVIWFVGLMAMAEVITTVIFLDRLRTDPALAAFGLIGLIGVIVGIRRIGALSRYIAIDTGRAPSSTDADQTPQPTSSTARGSAPSTS